MHELDIKDNLLMALHREGYPFVLSAAVATVVLGLIAPLLWWPGVAATLYLFFAFRKPHAVPPLSEHALLAPVSGTVIVSEAKGKESGSKAQEPFVVTIAATVLDASVLRFPLTGKVLRRTDNSAPPAGFDFRKARDNANNTDLALKASAGEEYALNIRASALGRSVSLDLPSSSEDIEGASAFGFLRFGGVVQITFDANDFTPIAAIGQRLKAGESILALGKKAK